MSSIKLNKQLQVRKDAERAVKAYELRRENEVPHVASAARLPCITLIVLCWLYAQKYKSRLDAVPAVLTRKLLVRDAKLQATFASVRLTTFSPCIPADSGVLMSW